MNVTILGSDFCVPTKIIDNDYFRDVLGLDTSAEWIESKTGIRERRFSSEEDTLADLAAYAAERALQEAGLDAGELDQIVVATITPDNVVPPAACQVQERLGAEHAAAFDLHAGCAGFVFAFDTAARYLQGRVGHALVIGADFGSRLVSQQDRTTCVFFGDGAGAVVISSAGAGRLLASRMWTRGDCDPLQIPSGGVMRMEGRAIWDFATRIIPETLDQLCRDAGVNLLDVRLLVPHQANRKLIIAALEPIGFPLDRVAINLDRYGNTIAASIPIALAEALRAGRAGPGDLIALIGFGAGLAWGGQILRLG